MKILFCDDDIERPETGDSDYVDLCLAIEDEGIEPYAVEVARNGREMVDKLASTAYDGIILDIMMPAGPNPPPYLSDVPGYAIGLAILETFAAGRFKQNQGKPLVILTGTAVYETQKGIRKAVSRHANIKAFEKSILMKTILKTLIGLLEEEKKDDEQKDE